MYKGIAVSKWNGKYDIIVNDIFLDKTLEKKIQNWLFDGDYDFVIDKEMDGYYMAIIYYVNHRLSFSSCIDSELKTRILDMIDDVEDIDRGVDF